MPSGNVGSVSVTASTPLLTPDLLPPVQGTFDELGRALRDITFVVVDLETTGGSAASCSITEIGAVKVRGGAVLGRFQTLVNPQGSIPPFISVLTGITDAMVASSPRIAEVLPAFLEFAKGSVLVAHNAPFDLGFLKAACASTGTEWPGFDSVDTARLARRALSRDEAPNCKLSTLAQLFSTTVTPNHRALADAEATVDVLHALIGRLGNLGVQSWEELRTYSGQVSTAQRHKRHLADGLPAAPGVYLFRDAGGKVLYVGTSSNLRTRVRQYFHASEQRTRMAEMVGLAERVDHVRCAHALEAQVRELRLIAEHRPRYNTRSKFPEKVSWLKLTDEPFPRLSTTREVRDDGATYLGPFSSSRAREEAATALHEALPLRQCTGRLPLRPSRSACVLAEIGRCGAPCDGSQTVAAYAEVVAAAREALTRSPSLVVDALRARIDTLAVDERFEDAAAQRDRLAALLRAVARQQRLTSLAEVPHLVAARPTAAGGWDLVVLHHGRLVSSGSTPYGAPVRPTVAALRATAETVLTHRPGPTPCAELEEMEVVLRWLGSPGTRLVELEGAWHSTAFGAGAHADLVEAASAGHRALADPRDRPALRPVGPAEPAASSRTGPGRAASPWRGLAPTPSGVRAIGAHTGGPRP